MRGTGRTALTIAMLLMANGAAAAQGGWGYSGATGPAHWGKLGHPLCAKGRNQSPVDIIGETPSHEKTLRFNYSQVPIDAINNGHTVQFNIRPGSHIILDDTRYDLLQFHFHTPSEDAVEGKRYPMQLHLVHKSDSGKLAVVGVFLQDVPNAQVSESMTRIFGALPGSSGLQLRSDTTLQPAELLPAEHKAWHFMGSLTTPPCTEGVQWLVMKTPVAITPRQLARFQGICTHNARPVQPWHRRLTDIAAVKQAAIEAKRKAEEAARLKAEEAHKAEESIRKAEEAKKAAEVKRKAEEARKVAEAKRKAMEAKQAAEAKRKAAEAAKKVATPEARPATAVPAEAIPVIPATQPVKSTAKSKSAATPAKQPAKPKSAAAPASASEEPSGTVIKPPPVVEETPLPSPGNAAEALPYDDEKHAVLIHHGVSRQEIRS